MRASHRRGGACRSTRIHRHQPASTARHTLDEEYPADQFPDQSQTEVEIEPAVRPVLVPTHCRCTTRAVQTPLFRHRSAGAIWLAGSAPSAPQPASQPE